MSAHKPRAPWTRRAFVAGGLAAAACPMPVIAAALPGKPEKSKLLLGLAVAGSNFVPVYIAAERSWKEQGLEVEMVTFRGDPEVAQALAGGSIDFSLASVGGVINLVKAGQPVRGFYAGFNQAVFGWIAEPSVKSWADLKGKTIGISTYASLTDALTRYMLKKNGVEPEKEVGIVQTGGTPSAYQALKSGKINAAILSPPFKWIAEEEGFTVLGSEAKDISPTWPSNLYQATTGFLDKYPNSAMALLRGHVAAIRLARADRAYAVRQMIDHLKYSERYANRAYDETIDGYDERGNLPASAMPIFWQTEIANKDVEAPWDEARFIDRRFIDRFSEWAP